MEQFLRIGVITTSHGLKGEVKVFPTTDSLERFEEVKNVILLTPKGQIETEITGVRYFKNLVIVKFAAFNDVEQVKNLHNTDVMIRREDAQPLEEGEYYIADLLGCRVYAAQEGASTKLESTAQEGAATAREGTALEGAATAREGAALEGPATAQDNIAAENEGLRGMFLGTLKDVLQTGANDVYIVDVTSGDDPSLGDRSGELLLPVIPDCIRHVDIEKGEILVNLMPGLV